MRETYWDQFMMTGRIEDYLNYKMGGNCCGRKEETPGEQHPDSEDGRSGVFGSKSISSDRRKEQCESDRTYRDGAVHGTGW